MKKVYLILCIALICSLCFTGCASNEYNNAVNEFKKIEKFYDEASIIQERLDTKTNSAEDAENIKAIDENIRTSITTLDLIFNSMTDSDKIKFGEYLRKTPPAAILDYMRTVIKESQNFDKSGLFIRILLVEFGFGSTSEFIEREHAAQAADVTIDSLIGTWYCSNRNSVNNMEIYLTFTKTDEEILYKREMIDSSGGDAGSLIEGTITISSMQSSILSARDDKRPDDSFQIDYLNDDNQYIDLDAMGDTLYEKFGDDKLNEFRRIE